MDVTRYVCDREGLVHDAVQLKLMLWARTLCP
jgi:hypothetical protein